MPHTIERATTHRRTGLSGTGGASPPYGPHPPRRWPQPPLSPAPVRRPVPCREEDPELWFAESPTVLEQAKALCTECPLRDACLAGALDRGEPWGVWGGEIFDRGVVIARKRPRGRPRKVTAA